MVPAHPATPCQAVGGHLRLLFDRWDPPPQFMPGTRFPARAEQPGRTALSFVFLFPSWGDGRKLEANPLTSQSLGPARTCFVARRSDPHRPRFRWRPLPGRLGRGRRAAAVPATVLAHHRPGPYRRGHLRLRHRLRVRPEAHQALPPGQPGGGLRLHGQVIPAPCTPSCDSHGLCDVHHLGHGSARALPRGQAQRQLVVWRDSTRPGPEPPRRPLQPCAQHHFDLDQRQECV